jgi:trigger factor
VEKDGIVFTAKFEPTPNVTVDKYDNLAITPETEAVTESEIDNEVNRLIQQDIMLKPKSADKPVADGDNVNIDFKGLRDGKEFPGGSSKDFDLIIGSKTFIDGFETQLIGMKLNETKTIDIVFPDDYGKVDMRGQKVQFEVKINSIAEVIKPELTPAYLEKFSFAVMKNENDLRLAIKRNLTESKELSAKENLKQKVSRELLTRIHISYIPKAYIINERNRLLRQTEGEAQQHHTSLDHYIKSLGFKNDEEYQFAIADAAKSNVTVALGFEHIVAEQKIVVTDKDVEQYLEKLAKVYKTTVPAIKSQLQNNFEGVKGFIMQEKVVEHILSVNKIKG